MWKLLAGVAASFAGWALWDLWRSSASSPAPQVNAPAGVRNAVSVDPELAAVMRRAVACGVQPNDWVYTLRWSRRFGGAMSMRARLNLMHSAEAYEAWPDFAKRIDCALRDPAPPPPPPAKLPPPVLKGL